MGSCTFSSALERPCRIGWGTCSLQKDSLPGRFQFLLPGPHQKTSVCLQSNGRPGIGLDHRQLNLALKCSKVDQKTRLSRNSFSGQAVALTPTPTAPPVSDVQPWQDGRHGVVFSAKELKQATGGKLLKDGPLGSICTDSRNVQEGDWFVALKGDRFDGHDFLDQVAQKGCAGAIGIAMPSSWSRGFLEVDDPLTALQQLASHIRDCFEGPVVGITGSSGKTGTRAMVGLALKSLGHVHETRGNLNNHIGVPLTLLATPSQSKAAVLELGMNHAGEIAELAGICRPTVRLITNVGPVHLEGLGTVEAVAQAKGELFETSRAGDTVVLNMDDPLVAALPLPDGVRVVRYGSGAGVDVRLLNVRTTDGGLGVKCVLQRKEGERTIESSLLKIDHPGVHLLKNAAAAAALAIALGVPLKTAVRGIQEYEPVGMRMKVQKCYKSGITLLNDAYNANPMSVKGALEVLARVECGGKKVALLGDMLELGQASRQAHIEVLQQCVESRIELVAVCGEAFREAAASIAPSDLDLGDKLFAVFPDSETLAKAISMEGAGGSLTLGIGDLVLVKGSRGLKMERTCEIIEGLEYHSDAAF